LPISVTLGAQEGAEKCPTINTASASLNVSPETLVAPKNFGHYAVAQSQKICFANRTACESNCTRIEPLRPTERLTIASVRAGIDRQQQNPQVGTKSPMRSPD
jgi:hypothetical protein